MRHTYQHEVKNKEKVDRVSETSTVVDIGTARTLVFSKGCPRALKVAYTAGPANWVLAMTLKREYQCPGITMAT